MLFPDFPEEPKFKLRPYQQEAVQNCLADLQEIQKAGLIVPTGGGKTEIFAKVSERFLQLNPGSSVLILSHLSLLTKQTYDRFKERVPHLEVGIFQADQLPSQDAQVIIGTMQTSRDGKKTDFLKFRANREVGLVIIDEAHYLDNASYNKTLNEWFPKAKQLGCTATPFRSGALMTNYFDKISFSISLQELIDQGFLVPPKLVEVEYDEKELPDIMAMVARLYLEKEKGRKALVFMTSIEDAKQMRNVLDNHGVKAHAITSELVGDERDKILRAFKDGKIDVLTTVNVLTAGFDSPNVEAIFMPYPTQSPTTYLQRVGRGLRPCPEIGKTECRIYVCGDAPAISREQYKKLHEEVLDKGSKKNKFTTFEEDLEYNEADKSSEIYRWTVTVCETVEKMQALGMEQLASRLNEKAFPKKFLRDIGAFASSLPLGGVTGAVRSPMDPATKAQLDVLAIHGFTPECLEGLRKGEASMMVAACLTLRDKWKADPFVIAGGKFAGRHVKETNWYYRKFIMDNQPEGEIAQKIRAWEKQGGKYVKAKK